MTYDGDDTKAPRAARDAACHLSDLLDLHQSVTHQKAAQALWDSCRMLRDAILKELR
jgi:hypothetical protein